MNCFKINSNRVSRPRNSVGTQAELVGVARRNRTIWCAGGTVWLALLLVGNVEADFFIATKNADLEELRRLIAPVELGSYRVSPESGTVRYYFGGLLENEVHEAGRLERLKRSDPVLLVRPISNDGKIRLATVPIPYRWLEVENDPDCSEDLERWVGDFSRVTSPSPGSKAYFEFLNRIVDPSEALNLSGYAESANYSETNLTLGPLLKEILSDSRLRELAPGSLDWRQKYEQLPARTKQQMTPLISLLDSAGTTEESMAAAEASVRIAVGEMYDRLVKQKSFTSEFGIGGLLKLPVLIAANRIHRFADGGYESHALGLYNWMLQFLLATVDMSKSDRFGPLPFDGYGVIRDLIDKSSAGIGLSASSSPYSQMNEEELQKYVRKRRETWLYGSEAEWDYFVENHHTQCREVMKKLLSDPDRLGHVRHWGHYTEVQGLYFPRFLPLNSFDVSLVALEMLNGIEPELLAQMPEWMYRYALRHWLLYCDDALTPTLEGELASGPLAKSIKADFSRVRELAIALTRSWISAFMRGTFSNVANGNESGIELLTDEVEGLVRYPDELFEHGDYLRRLWDFVLPHANQAEVQYASMMSLWTARDECMRICIPRGENEKVKKLQPRHADYLEQTIRAVARIAGRVDPGNEDGKAYFDNINELIYGLRQSAKGLPGANTPAETGSAVGAVEFLKVWDDVLRN